MTKIRQNQGLAILKTAGIITIALAMIRFPQDVLSAAADGISVWAKYVVPSLLPFFILSELLIGVGFVHLLGVLFEPVMRPIFRLPGSAAFVMAMGFLSGPPISAILTAKLRRSELLSRLEAERLISFTNNASPGFVLGAVSAGMFANPALGVVLAFSGYLANLLLGIGLRFYGREDSPTVQAPGGSSIWRRAFRAMYRTQVKDSRPFGQLIGDSIRTSINTILTVGGFILFFSVLLRLLAQLGILHSLSQLLAIVLSPLGLHNSLYPAISNGLFEMTLGTKSASQSVAPLNQQIILVSSLMAWSGISVHAQVASFISGTDIRLTPFVIARTAQAGLAAIITAVCLDYPGLVPVFQTVGTGIKPWRTEIIALALATIVSIFATLAVIMVFLLLTMAKVGFIRLVKHLFRKL
ncbi:MAG TPA: sporulation integral membrane protein YlbJ [Desulfobacteria bacterium]|nr:sporulation integral membrane protein YlbJ [Desulfobacteria bacterium]